MRLKISHTTRYDFDAPVSYGLQPLRGTPKSTRGQTVLSWETRIEGGAVELQFDDYHRNHVQLVGFDSETTALSILSEGEVELAETHGIVGPHEGFAPLWLFQQGTALTNAGQGCLDLISELPDVAAVDRLHALSAGIANRVAYETGKSQLHWSAEDVLRAGHGVCQDHTHVFLACARSMGFPARYVSGYLMMNDRVSQDAMHAWAEAHVAGLGWVGFDVSNGISPDTRYVRVATGLDYGQAAPISGTRFGDAGERLSVAVEVAQQ
jgi:transglutaminase-like putative cysteine protease